MISAGGIVITLVLGTLVGTLEAGIITKVVELIVITSVTVFGTELFGIKTGEVGKVTDVGILTV